MRNLARLFPLSALLLFCLTVLSIEAQADPTVIVTGSVSATGPSGNLNPFSLGGTDFAVRGSGGDFGRVDAAGCFPCRAGSILSLDSSFVGSALGSGPATINGISYERLFYEGMLDFKSGPVVISEEAGLSLMTPFTFTGTLAGCTVSTVSGCPGGFIFSTMLSGQGIATLQLSSFFDTVRGERLFQFRSITYDFTPIPEPATLLLLGTGLAGVAARYRRRRAGSNG